MPIYEKVWWKRLFRKDEHKKKEDALKDITVIKENLSELKKEVKVLLPLLEKLEELEKERQVAHKENIITTNLNTQAELLDKLLQRYEFFQNDIDVNGIRVKRIAKALLGHAKKAGLKDLVKEKKKDMKWTFDW